MESTVAITTPESNHLSVASMELMIAVTRYLTLRKAREEIEAQEKLVANKLLEGMTRMDIKAVECPLGTVLRVDQHQREQRLDIKAAKELLAAANLPIPMKPVLVRAHVKVLGEDESR